MDPRESNIKLGNAFRGCAFKVKEIGEFSENLYFRVAQIYTKIASEDDKLKKFYELDEELEHYKQANKVGEDHINNLMKNIAMKEAKKH